MKSEVRYSLRILGLLLKPRRAAFTSTITAVVKFLQKFLDPDPDPIDHLTQLTHHFLAKTQFTQEKVLFTHKLWPTLLPTNTVTPNRLYTSLPAPMYIYADCLFRWLFYILFQLQCICYPALGPQGCY